MRGARQMVRYSIVEVLKAKSRLKSPHTRDSGGERPSRTQYNQLLTIDVLGFNRREAYALVCNSRFCPMVRFEMVFVSLMGNLNSKSEK
jgi:hypothetical protein